MANTAKTNPPSDGAAADAATAPLPRPVTAAPRPPPNTPNTKPRKSVEELEFVARQKALMNPLALFFLGNVAALKVMGFYLITLETFLTCGLTVGLTIYWYFTYLENDEWNGGGLDFVLLAFAVTTPISAAIGMAFSRRERALIAIADFRSFSYQLFCAHCMWDWDTGDSDQMGRQRAQSLQKVDWLEHCDGVMAELIGIGDELSRFLTLPSTSRSRHRLTKKGRQEASRTMEVAYYLLESMTTQRMTRLIQYSERLKAIGLPSGEVSRIRQYERFISDILEQLRMIKLYRTPQALRSFARVFTILLPPFYSPTYAQVAMDVNSLGIGIAFGILTALGLTALFESLQVLEDPFTAYLALDGIDAREELEVLHFTQLVQTRELVFPKAADYPTGRRPALTRWNNGNSTVDGKPAPAPSTAGVKYTPPPATSTPSVHSALTMEGGTHHTATNLPPVEEKDDDIPRKIVFDPSEVDFGLLFDAGTVASTHRGSVFEEDRVEEENEGTSPHHRHNPSFFSLDTLMTGGGGSNHPFRQATANAPPTSISGDASAATRSPYHRRTPTATSAAGMLNPHSKRRIPDF